MLEKLPKAFHRERYAKKRRQERGRPAINRDFRLNAMHNGNLKQQEEDEVAEWVEEDQISDYNTMVVPYGKKFTAAKILRLLYSKDLLLNSEWNKPKDREVSLHRHPCFFGTAEEVLEDCCGYCPEPKTDEEKEIAEVESKLYISGTLKFIKDDPGRQEVGSFNPITTDDWTEMGYVGNTQMLCQAIVDGDLDYIRSWLDQEGNNPDTRDYVGRTPLHLATINGSTDVVKLLVEGGAKLIYRLLDGRSALHIASQLGHAEIVKILMDKSLENEEKENEKADKKADEIRAARAADMKKKEKAAAKAAASHEENDIDMVDNESESDSEPLGDEDTDMDEEGSDDDSETQGFTKLKIDDDKKPEASNDIPDDNEDEPDFYDVNAPAWDMQCAPLHFAIMGGHVPVLLMLVEDYGADVLNPIKLAKTDQHDRDNKAILPLVLATFAPEDKAKEVVKTLLDLGATTAQADMKHFTALHYIAEANKLDIIDLLFKHDAPAAKSALDIVPLSNDSRARTALSLALLECHEEMAKKLLSYGAKTSVSYDDWIEQYFRKYEYARNHTHEENVRLFHFTCQQPIISAASKELTTIVREMVEKGAGVNSLTLHGHRKAVEKHSFLAGHSLLDIVQWQIKKYGEFDCTKEKERSSYERRNGSVKPETLKDESYYLAGLKPGTYQYWTAQNRFRSVKAFNEQLWAYYNAQIKVADELLEEKKAKMERAAAKKEEAAAKKFELEELEAFLISRGAKTFKKLHPDAQQPDRHNHNNREYQCPNESDFEDYETKFTFNRPTLSEHEKEGYTRLFEATWRNDIDEVKALTLGQWTAAAGTTQEPLHVAVTDRIQPQQEYYDGYSGKPPPKIAYHFTGMHPLAIAILKGHQQLAKVIMEIALAQYEKPDSAKKPSKRAKRSQWGLEIFAKENEDYSEDDDEEDGSVRFVSRLVDDTYTIDNIAALAKSTKSSVAPSQLLTWSCSAPWFDPKYDEKTQKALKNITELSKNKNNRQNRPQDFKNRWSQLNQSTLTEHAIVTDDLPLLRFLWDICPEKQGEPTGYFDRAIRLGRTAIMAEMIRRVGPYVGKLVSTAPGVVKREEAPEYYQGLNVGGKKNKAWVEEANPDHETTYECDFSRESSPLIRAVKFGNLESVQWFLTELPLQEYIKYAEAYPDDQDILDLKASPGGYKKAISDWLGLRKDLILHSYLATKRDSTPDKPLLDYLLQQFPQLLEKRSIGGLTPLMIAIKHQSVHIIKKVMDAGADTRAKDGNGYNMMHYLFKPNHQNPNTYIRPRIELFKRQDVEEMLMERSRGGEQVRQSKMSKFEGVLDIHKLIDSFIGGQDLILRNGGGDFPLHVAIKEDNPLLVRHLLSFAPQVANWENASGITAYEMAEARELSIIAREAKELRGYNYGRQEFVEGNGILIDKPQGGESTQLHLLGLKGPIRKSAIVYEILKETKAELESLATPGGGWKRRLLTLGEANEVVKRIEGGRNNHVRAFAQVKEEKTTKTVMWDESVGVALQ